jgi:hypothetical protein
MPFGIYMSTDDGTNEKTSLMAVDSNGIDENDDFEGSGNRNENKILRYGERSNDEEERDNDDDIDDDNSTNLNLLRESLNKLKDADTTGEEGLLSIWTIICILSTSFAYGCIMTTLFLITLPIECDRIENNTAIPKSVREICSKHKHSNFVVILLLVFYIFMRTGCDQSNRHFLLLKRRGRYLTFFLSFFFNTILRPRSHLVALLQFPVLLN